jgi:uncharacterized protein YukE
MADSSSEFGNPQSVQDLANAGQQTITTLEKLDALVNSDVMSTVPDRWGGDAAGAFGRFWGKYMRCVGTHNSDTGTWCRAISRAAETMASAREQLANTRRFTDANGLVIGNDLVVRPTDPSRPGIQALVVEAQRGVDNARQLAQLARQEIRMANQEYQEKITATREELVELGVGILAKKGGKGKGGGRKQGRQTAAERAYEGTVRKPAPEKGEWVRGDTNNGVWKPNRPGEYGLQWPKDTITWKEGVPNLREHTVPLDRMPDGRPGVLDNMRGLNGKYKNDYKLADEELASRFGPGWTPERVADWRKANDYVYHHYSTSELQLVPGRIHRPLAHDGGAGDLRWP